MAGLFVPTLAFADVVVVQALNFFYSPASVTVSAGDTVRFQWVAGSHPTSSTTGDWAGFVFFPLNSSQPTYDLVMPSPGTFNYQCDFHAGIGMIGTITVTGSSCSTSSAPTGQSSTALSNRVRLNWTPQSGAVACQVQGKQVPTGPSPRININSAPINTTDVPYAAVPAGTMWTWRVRCACNISPLEVSPYTAYGDTFSIPALREAMPEIQVRMYPNPSDAEIALEWTALEAGNVPLEIIGMDGRLIERLQVSATVGTNRMSWSTAAYPEGVYFARIGDMPVQPFTVSH